MGTGTQYSADENFLSVLKSRTTFSPLQHAPISRTEFEEEVEKFFLPWMDQDERDGFMAFKLTFFDDLSHSQASEAMGIPVDSLRYSLGAFANIVAWLMPPQNCAELSPSLSASLRCLKTQRPVLKRGRQRAFFGYIPRSVANASIQKALPIIAQMQKIVAKGARNARISPEDALQEALLASCDAINTYDQNKGSFENFLHYCISRRLASRSMREYADRHRRPDGHSIDYALPTIVGGDNTPPFSSYLNDPRSSVRSISLDDKAISSMATVVLSLTPMELSVLRSRVRGLSYAATARFLRMSSKAVDNALCRIARKFSTKRRSPRPLRRP